MRWSKAYIPTLKEAPADAEVISHKLLLRAGMVRRLTSGIYIYLPLGLKILNKATQIVRFEMNDAGTLEVLMPMVQPADLWQETGRWDMYGKELLRLKDRHQRDYCLGPTHEEVITHLVRGEIKSYRQLPVNLYQIQTKFRDEIRPRFGLMRGREFLMKDAYSFDATDAGADESYLKMYAAYMRIFRRMGLKFRAVEADSGSIGGSFSHEFMVLADTGEDTIVACMDCEYAANVERAAVAWSGIHKDKSTITSADPCPQCGGIITLPKGIEVGHVFKLGLKYSEAMKATFLDEQGKEQYMVMGCYGIGVSRVVAACLEQNHDAGGCIFPPPLAPFDVLLINLDPQSTEVTNRIDEIYGNLLLEDIDVLLDDRNERPGVKFKDADLIGVPMQITLGGKSLARNVVEAKCRRTGEKTELDIDNFMEDFMVWQTKVLFGWGL